MCITASQKTRVTEHEIIENRKIKDGYYMMSFECEGLRDAKPGQFLSISMNGVEKGMPIRRPFTIYKLQGSKVTIIYKVVGKGTSIYKTLQPGDKINVLGPLGNTFEVESNKKALVIGRGAGLATLANLGNALKDNGCNVTTVGSFRSEEVNFIDDFIRNFSDELIVITDEDGTSGLDNLEQIVNRVNPDVIYVSGTTRVARMLQKTDYKTYVNLEERMGCGLGACLTCPVQTPEGFKRVCKDGPCFDLKEVIL